MHKNCSKMHVLFQKQVYNFQLFSSCQVESGIRYANGIQVNPNSLTSVSAYIQQNELFFSTLTVREHLNFQASVRMDKDIPHERRMQRVEAVAKEVGVAKLIIDISIRRYVMRNIFFERRYSLLSSVSTFDNLFCFSQVY